MTDIPRSMEATSGPAAARVDAERRTLPRGVWAIALVIATEFTLFASLIATYFYLRFRTDSWPPDGIPDPSVVMPLVLTGVLIVSTVPMAAAVRAARAARRRAAWWLVALAAAIQGTYLGLQIHLFTDDFHRFSPSDDAYASIYFTLLGVHHAHVAVGLVLDAWLLAVLAFGLTNYRLLALRVASYYWYFVAAIGVAVVFTQIYPSL
ncbi:MAG TPA: cytochrome c oxidase subunit 3 [Solirubrobacterales bacterium]